MAFLKQSTVYSRTFFLVDSVDHISAKTLVTPTVLLSKGGGVFAAAAGVVSEISGGWYKIALTAVDTNTLGDLSFIITGTGADPTAFVDQVIAIDLADAVAFGLSRLDAAVSSRSTYAGGAVASVTAGVTVATNTDKSGYSLAAAQTFNITGNLSGSVGSVTGAVGSVTGAVGSVIGTVGSVIAGCTLTPGERTSIGTAVWATASRTLTTFGTLTTDTATAVWVNATRSLTTFGTLVSDIATAVWGAATRTLTAFGFTISTSVSAGDITNIADGILKRDMSLVTGESSRSLLNAIRFLRNRWRISAGSLTVYREDDTTAAWAAPVTTTTGADPITEVDPV